jgi:membrane protein implicated in regulation of membrane protease activity
MPYGDWINELPTGFFLAVHIAAFTLGAGFAWLAFKRELALLGSAFSLFAAAVHSTVRRPVLGLSRS